MLETKLIGKSDVRKFFQISETLNDDTFNQFVQQAQLQDVAPLLGEALFLDIMRSPSEYSDLLTGGDYTYRETLYHNMGLKAVLSHYTYARYRMFGTAVDTPFGFIEKLGGNESRPESESSKKTSYTLNRDSAFTIWKSVENYLIRMEVPLYGDNYLKPHRVDRNSGGLKMSKISKYGN
jgi:hypothetical protein